MKRIVALSLAALLALGSSVPVMADELSDMQAAVAQNTKKLEEICASIDALEEQKVELAGEIDSLDGQLVTTIARIQMLNDDITNIIRDLAKTASHLAAAEATETVQYKAMKKRIQYLYESGGEAGWAKAFLERGEISDVLNKTEYTEKMYEYDRKCLQDYAAIVQAVEDLQSQQRRERSQLEEARMGQRSQQEKLEGLLEEAHLTYDDYEAKLKDANNVAEEYIKLIDQQNEEIRRLEAEREAARIAAEQAAAAAQAASYQYQAEVQAAIQQAYNNGYNGTAESIDFSGYTGNSDIVSYAMQFLGNPYRWGGNSLTNGIDCSHFVTSVLQNTGNYSGSYHVAEDWVNIGTGISYSDVQPGDVLCYDHHVAIYAGDGKIVHASDYDTGIIVSDANASKVISVRRVNG